MLRQVVLPLTHRILSIFFCRRCSFFYFSIKSAFLRLEDRMSVKFPLVCDATKFESRRDFKAHVVWAQPHSWQAFNCDQTENILLYKMWKRHKTQSDIFWTSLSKCNICIHTDVKSALSTTFNVILPPMSLPSYIIDGECYSCAVYDNCPGHSGTSPGSENTVVLLLVVQWSWKEATTGS